MGQCYPSGEKEHVAQPRDSPQGLPTFLAQPGNHRIGDAAGTGQEGPKDRAPPGTGQGDIAESLLGGGGRSINSKNKQQLATEGLAQRPQEGPQSLQPAMDTVSFLVHLSGAPVLGEPTFRPQQVGEK